MKAIREKLGYFDGTRAFCAAWDVKNTISIPNLARKIEPSADKETLPEIIATLRKFTFHFESKSSFYDYKQAVRFAYAYRASAKVYDIAIELKKILTQEEKSPVKTIGTLEGV